MNLTANWSLMWLQKNCKRLCKYLAHFRALPLGVCILQSGKCDFFLTLLDTCNHCRTDLKCAQSFCLLLLLFFFFLYARSVSNVMTIPSIKTLQGIMVVVFIILDWMFFVKKATTDWNPFTEWMGPQNSAGLINGVTAFFLKENGRVSLIKYPY